MIQIDQTVLEDLPIGLLLVDDRDQIRWVNTQTTNLLALDAEQLIGVRISALPDSARRLLTTEPALIQDASSRRWLRRELRQGADGQRLIVISDVTAQEQLAEDNARLRQQVEDLKLTDELTGMPNRRAISQALDLHISRSRRYQNPLSTALVSVEVGGAAQVHPLSTDPVILSVSRFLRDRLRWVDQIARWEDNLFLLVLPETTEQDARSLLDKIISEQAGMVLPDGYGDARPTLTVGLASWRKGDDMRTLLTRALHTLKENSGA